MGFHELQWEELSEDLYFRLFLQNVTSAVSACFLSRFNILKYYNILVLTFFGNRDKQKLA